MSEIRRSLVFDTQPTICARAGMLAYQVAVQALVWLIYEIIMLLIKLKK